MKYACPQCKNTGSIAVTATIIVPIDEDGEAIEYWYDFLDWNDGSPCKCCSCNFEGTLTNFILDEHTAS